MWTVVEWRIARPLSMVPRRRVCAPLFDSWNNRDRPRELLTPFHEWNDGSQCAAEQVPSAVSDSAVTRTRIACVMTETHTGVFSDIVKYLTTVVKMVSESFTRNSFLCAQKLGFALVGAKQVEHGKFKH